MKETDKSMYVDVTEVMKDCGVSRTTAYRIIKHMNEQVKDDHPLALIIPGRVNRLWYNEACLRKGGGDGYE